MKARIARLLAAALAAFLCSFAHAAAEPERYALVIGNSDYDGDGRLDPGHAQSGYEDDLRNPRNDARLIGATLNGLGFKVTQVTDADLPMMQNALSDFAETVAHASSDAVAVIYYSGHGLQVDGYNYLIPTRAKLVRPDLPQMTPRVRREILGNLTIPADEILGVLGDRPDGMTILILDACRDNPWDRSVKGLDRGSLTRGLERMSAPEGALIAFSTKANDVAPDGDGNNSPYALSLSRWMKTPGLYVEQAFKQVGIELSRKFGQQPDVETALRADFCFNLCPAEQAAAAKPPPVAAMSPEPPQQPPSVTGVRTFIVFFDYNKSELTEKAAEVVQAAAANYEAMKSKRCITTGHIDGAELTAGYERKAGKTVPLSQRRANSVKAYLALLGLKATIVAQGKGFADPLVPTGPGAREPQNRRTVMDCD
ncbi:MAG TPA: caspase family protein [Rhizomicrobium sp.]|nr:caspase family protein [Rhizomicrobium sp.]